MYCERNRNSSWKIQNLAGYFLYLPFPWAYLGELVIILPTLYLNSEKDHLMLRSPLLPDKSRKMLSFHAYFQMDSVY